MKQEIDWNMTSMMFRRLHQVHLGSGRQNERSGR